MGDLPLDPDPRPTTQARLREELVRHAVLRDVDRLLIACSGGGDSVALLDLLHRLGDELGVRLAVVHVDHGTRPRESRAEAELVARLAAGRDLELHLERLGLDSSRSEADLRAARLAALERVAGRTGVSAVALGHTLDDRAETVLMNASRGCGIGGLGALRRRRRVGGLLLLRPLLGMRREALRAYLRARDIPWCEDSSNASERFTRNRVRARVMPELEAIVPGAHEALARLGELAAREEDWLTDLVRRRLDRLRRPDPLAGALALDAGLLRECPPGLRARVLRDALREVRGDLRGLGHDHVEAALGVIAGAEAARDLPDVRIRLEGGRVRLLPLENRRLAGVTGPDEASSEC